MGESSFNKFIKSWQGPFNLLFSLFTFPHTILFIHYQAHTVKDNVVVLSWFYQLKSMNGNQPNTKDRLLQKSCLQQEFGVSVPLTQVKVVLTTLFTH